MIYHSNGNLAGIIQTRNISQKTDVYDLNIWFLKPSIYLADVTANASAYSISSYPRAILLLEESNHLTLLKEYPYVHLEKELPGGGGTFEKAIMYRFNDQIRTYKVINDTIFTVGPDLEMEMAFVFDFGKYRASTKWMFALDNAKNPIYIWPENIMESTNYLFIEFFFGNHAPERFEYLYRWLGGAERMITDYRVFGLFDKRTGELKLMSQPIKKKLGFKNDIDGGPVIWPTIFQQMMNWFHLFSRKSLWNIMIISPIHLLN